MSENPQEATGLTIALTRVYFDTETGQILHVHRIASTGPLTDQEIAAEADAFAASIRERHGRALDSVEVDESELAAAVNPNVLLKIDTVGRRLVRDS